MSGTGNLQGFPNNSAPVVDANNAYRWTPAWLRWAMSIWIRSGTAQGGANAPTGSGQDFYGPASAIPTGWLLCDGSEISRVDFAALFSVIGTYYGAGDSSTTFNLPPSNSRFSIGAGTYPFATRGGATPITGGTLGYIAINKIIKY